MTPRAQRMAELRAIIEEAKAEMQAIKADEQIEKSDDAQAEANAIPEGMHEMEDGKLMADSEMIGAIGEPEYASLPDNADVEYEDIQKFTDDGVAIPIGGYPIPVGENVAKSMTRVDNEDGNLQKRNTDDAIAAYEADNVAETGEIFPVADRQLQGNRDNDGNFLEVPVNISAEDLDAQSFDKDKKTDAQSAKMKRSSNDPVEMIGDLEMDGGRAAAKEVESSERTMGMTQDEGGTSSVDTKDDFWKTQEGYDKAMEMYGDKPAWVKEPTMIFNPETQEYEKIKEEDKEQFEDLGMSADIKRMFG